MSDASHLIGLLLGTEEDWPRAFETLLSRVGPVTHKGATHHVTSPTTTVEKITRPTASSPIWRRLARKPR